MRAGGKVYADPVNKEVAAFAPATVANLGPGFDWMGCAVGVSLSMPMQHLQVFNMLCSDDMRSVREADYCHNDKALDVPLILLPPLKGWR